MDHWDHLDQPLCNSLSNSATQVLNRYNWRTAWTIGTIWTCSKSTLASLIMKHFNLWTAWTTGTTGTMGLAGHLRTLNANNRCDVNYVVPNVTQTVAQQFITYGTLQWLKCDWECCLLGYNNNNVITIIRLMQHM